MKFYRGRVLKDFIFLRQIAPLPHNLTDTLYLSYASLIETLLQLGQ